MEDERAGWSARVRGLVAALDPEQKRAQLGSAWLTLEPGTGDVAPFQGTFAPAPGDPDEQLRHGIGHLTRPLGSRPVEPTAGVEAVAAVQRRLVERSTAGLPAISHEECLAGVMVRDATQLPCPLALGATWDPALVEELGAVLRRQMRAVGAHQGLAPVADVVRDPRWGRVEECFGEDPYLVGSMVVAYVRGLQGDDLRTGVAATLKHFAGYPAGAGGRNFAPAQVGPREMADVLLVPFEMAVKLAGAASVMNAYNDVDGEPCGASRHLLTEVLRERWGFDGVVVADYFAVSFLEDMHGVAGDQAEAAALALRAGLDLELPATACYARLGEAAERGLATDDDVDLAVGRVLALKERLGLLDGPPVAPPAGPVELHAEADAELVRRAAVRSLVLLRNEGDLLPLGPVAPGARLAVLGPNADRPTAVLGNYSFAQHVADHFPDDDPGRLPRTVLDELGAAWEAAGGEVRHERGCEVDGDDRSGLPAAVAAATGADVAVVVAGDRAGHFGRGTVGEGTDTEDLSLPGVQAELVEAVVATGTPTVLVLLDGRPHVLGGLARQVPAVVQAFFPGEEGAAALAAVLLGEEAPGGRLPVSTGIPAGAQPATYLRRALSRGVPPRPAAEPEHAFGHGLTYTTFSLDELEVAPTEVPLDGEVEVACTVTNTGDRTGEEVVQLYLRDPVASVARPLLELRGFARVALEPGASALARFTVPADLCSFTGVDLRRVAEPGVIEVHVGRSSADLPLRASFTLVGDGPRHPGEDRRLVSEAVVVPT